jgi:DNA (cytosine-5)-methyltransferase 1
LFFEFVRVARELTPRWLLIENVKGLLSSSGGRDMGTVIGALGNLGYGVTYRLLDSQYFGLAQRRERVFIVGHLGTPWSASLEVLLEREGSPWDPAPGGGTRKDASRRIRAGAQSNSGVRQVVAALTANGVGTCGPDDNQAQAGHLVASKPTCEVSPTLQERGFKGADSDATQAFVVEEPIWMANGQDFAVAQGMTGAITGSNGQPGNVTAESLVRRLTPLECERLQGFPDGWTEGISDSRRYKALGNAVSVPVSSWIAKRIAAVNGHSVDVEEDIVGLVPPTSRSTVRMQVTSVRDATPSVVP